MDERERGSARRLRLLLLLLLLVRSSVDIFAGRSRGIVRRGSSGDDGSAGKCAVLSNREATTPTKLRHRVPKTMPALGVGPSVGDRSRGRRRGDPDALSSAASAPPVAARPGPPSSLRPSHPSPRPNTASPRPNSAPVPSTRAPRGVRKKPNLAGWGFSPGVPRARLPLVGADRGALVGDRGEGHGDSSHL